MNTNVAQNLSPMQSAVLSRVDTIFSSISDTLNSGMQFAKEQLPDIAREYITYGRVFNTTIEVITLLFLFVSLYVMIAYGFKIKAGLQNDRYGG